MQNLFSAALLGVVEGLTEFLPVSSTGHLILASSLLKLHGDAIKTFEVFIQLGAILAVVVLYWRRFVALVPGVAERAGAGKTAGRMYERLPGTMRFSGWRGLWLLFLTCLPASLLGLFAHSSIKAHLFNPRAVVVALVVGGICMLLLERFKKKARYHSLDQMNAKLAIGIGLCQCFALWPGFSRSAATIMGGMLLGADRKMAAEYSFIVAVPIMFAATGLDLYSNWGNLGSEHVTFFIVGFTVSFVSALLAIKLFIGILGKVGLAPFAWYRLALALPVYWFLWA